MSVIEILSGLLTPLIAIIAVYIAYQQYGVNKCRLNNDLFERRIPVFRVVNSFFGSVFAIGTVDMDELRKLRTGTREGKFVFGSEVGDYLEEIWEKGIYCYQLHQKLYGEDSLPVGDERTEISAQHAGVLEWFSNEDKVLDRKFKDYLSLS